MYWDLGKRERQILLGSKWYLLSSLYSSSSNIVGLAAAAAEHFVNIIVESDAKSCIDALAYPLDESCWKIRHLTSVSLDLTLSFPLCIFSWVKRDANHVAHSVAKVAPSFCLPFCCFKDNLPPSVKEAWIRDLFLLSS
jgi:hypothetical protein